MFFKKKVLSPAQLDTGMLFIGLGTELYRGLGKADGTSSLSATLGFDEQQRIVNIENPIVDGTPKIPPFDTVEAMNKLVRPMASLPMDQKLKSLRITIESGQINTKIQYLVN